MRTPSRSSTILVTEAAAMVPLGPRRFRQCVGLETPQGKEALELRYINGRAVIDRTRALAEVERLRRERLARQRLRQANLGLFVEPCSVDPETGERLCLEVNCGAAVSGRGKLCAAHSATRASTRAARRGRASSVGRRG